MPGGQSDYSISYDLGYGSQPSPSEWQAYNTYLPDQRLDYAGIRAALEAAGVTQPDSSWINYASEMSPQQIAAASQSQSVRLPDGRDAIIDINGNIVTSGTKDGRHYAMMYDPQGNLIREWDYEDKNDAWKRSLLGLAAVGIGGPLGGAGLESLIGGGTMAGTTAAELAVATGAGQGAGAAGAASALGGAAGTTALNSAASGAGFPGEGIASGVPEWDLAAEAAGLPLITPPGPLPNVNPGTPYPEDIAPGGSAPGSPDAVAAPPAGGSDSFQPSKILDTLTGGLSGSNIAKLLAAAALTRGMGGSSSGGGGGGGYQGGIPTLQYNRTQLNTNDPNRRPGSAGRNYFTPGTFTPAPQAMAGGGIAELAGGGQAGTPRYLGGPTDGMEDKIPAKIDGAEPAALSHGEFVIPADVVGHLGNGNSEAGAKRLYDMMDRIRQARTGTKQQGRQVDPNKFLPS